ncbi:homing endonuclease associated repeat-containing protein [Sulfobacillus harzensis]|uniref:homing endonuclease associated repeat-containing protein n=1 Tax=Sulfobacillus harzensis TaxID=2729629 RepID=UPI003B838063
MTHLRGLVTCERILAEIHRHAQQGHSLYARAIQARDNRLVSAATYRFGSWAKALGAAGFDSETLRGKVTGPALA